MSSDLEQFLIERFRPAILENLTFEDGPSQNLQPESLLEGLPRPPSETPSTCQLGKFTNQLMIRRFLKDEEQSIPSKQASPKTDPSVQDGKNIASEMGMECDSGAEEAIKIFDQPLSRKAIARHQRVTSLMVACHQGLEHDVRTIIAKKPSSVFDKDFTGKTGLHYCAQNNNFNCIQQILTTEPSLINAKDNDGFTILHLAVIAGNADLLKHLISKGADFNAVDKELRSLVHWATVCGEIASLNILGKSNANISTADMNGAYPIHYAVQMSTPSTMTGLIILRHLIHLGADVNVKDPHGRGPVMWAASAGSSDAIMSLVNAGALVNVPDHLGLTALHCAASRGNWEVIQTLVGLCNAEIDQQGCVSLNNDFVPQNNFLVLTDINGLTPLFYAVTLGHVECVKLLLSLGANPNHQDFKGRNPAHGGASKGQILTLQILHENNCNLWKENVRKDQPIHYAVHSGRKDLVLWLLSLKPEAVDASNVSGQQPLHQAAEANNIEMCQILVEHKAELNPIMKTSNGHFFTPLDLSKQHNLRTCEKYLRSSGCLSARQMLNNNDLSDPSRSPQSCETNYSSYSIESRTTENGNNIDNSSLVLSVYVESDARAEFEDEAAAILQEKNHLIQFQQKSTLEKSIQTEEIPEKEEKCVQTNGDILKTVEAQGYFYHGERIEEQNIEKKLIPTKPKGRKVVKKCLSMDHIKVIAQKDKNYSMDILQKSSTERSNHLEEKLTHNEVTKRSKSKSVMEDSKSEPDLQTLIMNSIRRYQAETRLIDELMKVKRVSIQSRSQNEEFSVKRLSIDYNKRSLISRDVLGYDGPFTFKDYEKHLYGQLDVLQKTGFLPIDINNLSDSVSLCTKNHAVSSYTGISQFECAKLPFIKGSAKTKKSVSLKSSSKGTVEQKMPLSLKIRHEDQTQTISLPANTKSIQESMMYNFKVSITTLNSLGKMAPFIVQQKSDEGQI